jgi:hypothetical protein
MTTWVVQENLAGEQAYDEFVGAIKEVAPIQIVKVVPFAHDLIPEIEGTKNIAFVSLTLENIARGRGWMPGTFTNNSHNFERWAEGYEGFLLNEDAEVFPFGEIPPFTGQRFIRPLDDSKVFAGMVIDGEDFEEWKKKVIDIQDDFSTLTSSTEVLIAPIQEIECEFRFFVIDKQVVTGSQYREMGYTRKRRVNMDGKNEDSRMNRALDFARQMVARWCPAKHFVIDVCMVGMMGNLKVVEINSLTSAGFYDCDTRAIVMALHEWMKRKGM